MEIVARFADNTVFNDSIAPRYQKDCDDLVRASVIRYLIDHGYSEETIREEINNQHEYYGFTWLPKDIEWYKGDVLEIFDEM